MTPKRPAVSRSAHCLLLLLGLPFGCGNSAEPAIRNVVFIVVDTLRRDHLAVYGYERDTSPSIDALANGGVRFDRAYATAGWTSPSVASMLTGLYPSGHGVVRPSTALSDEIPTLAEALRFSGFATAAIVSNHILGKRWGFARGFDSFDETNLKLHKGVSTGGVTASSIATLERLSAGDAPFFLFVHYFDPHYNYQRHDEFGFAPARAGRLEGGEDITLLRDLAGGVTQRELTFLRDLYDGEIRYTDAGIGRLLAALRSRGHFDDTLIVFAADHGEEFLERGWLGHTRTLYDELVRVPLILHLPQPPARRVIQEPVSLTSLPATIMQLLGLPIPQSFRSPSLVAQLSIAPDDSAPLRVLTEVDFVPASKLYAEKTARQQSLVGPRFKLIRNLLSGTVELYDMLSDPKEERDLSGSETARVREMTLQLDALLVEIASKDFIAREIELSDEEVRELQALGYGESPALTPIHAWPAPPARVNPSPR